MAYVFAVLAMVAAWLLATVSVLGHAPFVTFLLVVALVSWFLGRGPTLLAVLLACGVLAYFFLPPPYSFRIASAQNQLQLAYFALAGVAMSCLAQWYTQPVELHGGELHNGGRCPPGRNAAGDAPALAGASAHEGDGKEVVRLLLGHLFDVARYRYFVAGCVKRLFQTKVCPCCASEVSTTIDRKLVYRLEKCARCALRFRYPTDTAAEMRRYYEHMYRQKGLTTDLPDARELERLLATNFAGTSKDFRPLVRLLNDLGLPAGARVLDFGASWGYGTYQLRQAGYGAEACEISRPRAEFGQRLGVVVAQDPDSLAGPYHAVYAGHVLEHVSNPLETMHRLLGLTRPGGLVIAHTPNGSEACRAAYPALYHNLWGLPHPVLLSDEFVATNLSAYPCVVASGNNHGYDGALAGWDRQSNFCGDLRQPELLIIVRNQPRGVTR